MGVKKCLNCSKELNRLNNRAKYCNPSCKGMYHRNGIKPICSFEFNGGMTFESWYNQGVKSNNFIAWQYYEALLWNKYERFYKYGVTFRSDRIRFQAIPYNIKLLKSRVSFSKSKKRAKEIWQCEIRKASDVQRMGLRYLPHIPFYGQTECYNYPILIGPDVNSDFTPDASNWKGRLSNTN